MRYGYCSWYAARQETDLFADSDHDRRNEFWRFVGRSEGVTWPRRFRNGHFHNDWRWRNDVRGTAVVQNPGLPIFAFPIRNESGRFTDGGRDRDRTWPGRQARWWRHVVG